MSQLLPWWILIAPAALILVDSFFASKTTSVAHRDVRRADAL